MGRSQFLYSGLIAALLLVGCGEAPSLLVSGDVDADVYGAGGAGGFGPTSTVEADFGSISGVVKFKGRASKPRNLKLSDKFCINSNPSGMASEDFLFDPATGALENVFVYIQRGINKKIQDMHPVPSTPVVLDQVNCQYIPHTAFIRVGQPLVIKSQDNTLHNVAARPANSEPFNLTMNAPGALAPRTFERMEPKPMLIKCDVHGWMRSYLAILPHPYCVITAKDGAFSLKGVPPGKYKLVFWHEKVGELAVEVTLAKNEDKNLDAVTMERG
jgi:hypothetical protein